MTEIATTTAATTKDQVHLSPNSICQANHLQCPYQQQQRHLAIFFSPSITSATDASHTSTPSTWIDSNLHYCHCQITATSATTIDHQEDMNNLRQTIASLRDQSKQLEMTNLMVKKSIQVVAKKRRLAQHSSQWDWCDPLDDEEEEEEEELEEDDDDDHGMDSFHSFHSDSRKDDSDGVSVSILENDTNGTNHFQDQDCGGDWEWIN